MSLLDEIRTAATDGKTDLETLLRKCRVLASKLGHEPFKRWVQYELDGYVNGATLPEYRKLRCQNVGHFIAPMGGRIRNAPIANSSIPPDLRKVFTEVELRQGVGELKNLVVGCTIGEVRRMWPADALSYVSGQYDDIYQLAQAWTAIPVNNIAGILSTVHNRLLDFILEIEATNPSAGEAAPGTTPIPQDKITHIFHNNFFGTVGNVASGQDIEQSATVNVHQGDFDSLADFLKSHGIDDADIRELREAIKADPTPKRDGNFGNKVAGWMGKMLGKAASGAWHVTLDVGSKMLSEALSKHYGLKPE